MPGLVRNARFRHDVVLIGAEVAEEEPASAPVEIDDAEEQAPPATGWWTPLGNSARFDDILSEPEDSALADRTDPPDADVVDEVAELESAALARLAEADARLAEAEAILVESQREADRALADARARADRIEAEALAEAGHARDEIAARRADLEAEIAQLRAETFAEARQEGIDEGFEAGYLDGREIAHAEARDRVAALARVAEAAHVDRRELLHNAEGEVTRLALAIARRILDREPKLQPNTVVGVARAALRSIAATGRVRVRVNPSEEAHLSAQIEEIAPASADRAFDIVSDAEVTPGGVVIETGVGTVDARFETQLEEIARQVFDGVAPRSVP